MVDKYAFNVYNNPVEGIELKQRDLLNLFYRNGWQFQREGGNHIVIAKGKKVEAVPRHKEVSENLAKALIKRHGLK